jgi:hypothetical protein
MPNVPTPAELAARLDELARRDRTDAGATDQIRAISEEARRLYDDYFRVALDAACEVAMRRLKLP